MADYDYTGGERERGREREREGGTEGGMEKGRERKREKRKIMTNDDSGYRAYAMYTVQLLQQYIYFTTIDSTYTCTSTRIIQYNSLVNQPWVHYLQ